MSTMAGGAMGVMGAGLGVTVGGGGADFTGVGSAVLAGLIASLDGEITTLQGDSGGNTVAGVINDLFFLRGTFGGLQTAVSAINTLVGGDAILAALISGMAAVTGIDDVYYNLQDDVGGDHVAAAITDLQAAKAALQAL